MKFESLAKTVLADLYSVPSRVWTVPSLSAWKFWQIRDDFDPDGQLDSIAPETRSNPTAHRDRNHLEFVKIFMQTGTELSTLSMGQSIHLFVFEALSIFMFPCTRCCIFKCIQWHHQAFRLGYTAKDIKSWATQADPSMSMLAEWFSTHKTSNATNAILHELHEIDRLDVAKVIQDALDKAGTFIYWVFHNLSKFWRRRGAELFTHTSSGLNL